MNAQEQDERKAQPINKHGDAMTRLFMYRLVTLLCRRIGTSSDNTKTRKCEENVGWRRKWTIQKCPDCLEETTTHRPANMKLRLGLRDHCVRRLAVLPLEGKR